MRWSLVRPLVAEPELEADGLAQHLQQPLAPILGLRRTNARRQRHHERDPQRVKPLPQRSLERELERRRIADAAALFASGDPLAIDVPLAFTAAKLAEARNLRLLGEAAVRGIPSDLVRRELLWPGVRA